MQHRYNLPVHVANNSLFKAFRLGTVAETYHMEGDSENAELFDNLSLGWLDRYMVSMHGVNIELDCRVNLVPNMM